MQLGEWLETELQQDIWKNKYRHNNETLDEFFDRVSGGNKTIRQLMVEKRFLPAGRILANRGLQSESKKLTYSNCYVVDSPNDNIESIYDTAKEIARTFSYGGGVGVDLSQLAPKGAIINNAAKETTGAVSFMDLYSLTAEVISQSGRRGALIITLDCNHPDLEEFIDIKNDLNKVTKANISIKITDEFMEAVKLDNIYMLTFKRNETGQMIKKEVRARDIFRKIAQSNWQMGEPGFLFWDKINRWNMLVNDDNFKLESVNPCFAGDMKLLTIDGYKTFKELNNQKVKIINAKGDISESKVWESGEKDVIQLTLSNKKKIKCTEDHIFKLSNDINCQAKDTLNKRLFYYYGNTNISEDLFVQLGFLQGDGCIGRINSEHHLGLEVNIGHKDEEIFGLFGIKKVEQKRKYYINGFNELLIKYGFDGSPLPERVFPIKYTDWNKQQKSNFLKGCFSANGCVAKNHRVSYKTTSKIFALQLKKALNEFGITPNITKNKSKITKFENGSYLCKESYDININKIQDIILFYQNIGFMQRYKMNNLIELIKNKSPLVISIKKLGKQKVFDFNEPVTNWGVVEGVVVHNCGEEPLPKYGSCNLGAINLAEFVINPHTVDSQFNFGGFQNTISEAVIYMNEILEEGMSLHPLQQQRDVIKNWRQIGIGIMGLADMLIKMQLRYGEEASINLCDNIGKLLIDTAIKQSALLAKNYGDYPMYNQESVTASDFFIANTSTETSELVKQYGLRNSQLTTIAPTGSLSTMLGISGGIEPIYATSYTRKTESLHGEDKYYKIYTPIVKEYMEKMGTNENFLPYYFVSTMDIDYRERIEMQGIWQRHIDASISSTINVKENFTPEQIEELYMYAWEHGLKGVTVFRDNCARVGILQTKKKQEVVPNGLIRGSIINASDDLIGKKRKLITGCGSLYVMAYFDPVDGDLMETFFSKGSTGGCMNHSTSLSRIISLSARGGIFIKDIVDQLFSSGVCPSYNVRKVVKKDTSRGTSCPVAIGHALLDMHEEVLEELGLKEEEVEAKEVEKTTTPVNKEINKEVNEDNLCPDCKAELKFVSGCNECSCGFSRCG